MLLVRRKRITWKSQKADNMLLVKDWKDKEASSGCRMPERCRNLIPVSKGNGETKKRFVVFEYILVLVSDVYQNLLWSNLSLQLHVTCGFKIPLIQILLLQNPHLQISIK
jgi:hypothetical protein